MSSPRSWKNPPPVVVLSGGLEFLRLRELSRAVRAAGEAGRRVVRVAAGDEDSLQDVLSGSFLFTDTTLVVVESGSVKKKSKKSKKSKVEEDGGQEDGWGEESVAAIIAHSASTTNEVSILVHHAEDLTPTSLAGQVVAALPDGRHAAFLSPKPWKERDFAVEFFQKDLKRLGKTIAEPLAEAVVRQVGVDLGLLSFEALKVSTLLDWDGRTEVLKADLVGMLATFSAEDWQALKDALAGKNARGVLRALADIRSGPGGEVYQKAHAVVTSSVQRWLHAAALHEAGVGEEEAAGRVGLHPFPYKKDVHPVGVRWGAAPLAGLLKDVAQVGVRRGHMNPWVALESTLVLACQGR